MPNKRSGWNPKEEITNRYKRTTSNPAKIEMRENRLRPWENRFIDDGAMRLNDTENGEGNAYIRKRKPTKKTIDEILNIRKRR